MAYPYAQLVTDTMEMNLKLMQSQTGQENRTLKKYVLGNATPKGGRYVSFQVRLDKHNAVGAIDPYSTFDIANNQKRTKADVAWKTYRQSIQLFEYDKIINRSGSAEQVVDMVKDEFEAAQEAFEDDMATDFFQLATTDPLGFVGTQSMISVTPTLGTYLGISRVTNSRWQNQHTTMAVLDLDTMLTAFLNCSDGSDAPDDIVTTKTVIPIYNAKLTPIQRIASDTTANAGFKDLSFMGVPVKYDNSCPTGFMYMFNSKYMKSNYVRGGRFVKDPDLKPENKWASVTNIYYIGCVYCTRPQRQGVLDTIAA